jgi:cell division protein FtsL
MNRFFLFWHKHLKVIDRIILFFFLAWVLSVATVIIFRPRPAINISGDTAKQIQQIYEWAKKTLAPVQ